MYSTGCHRTAPKNVLEITAHSFPAGYHRNLTNNMLYNFIPYRELLHMVLTSASDMESPGQHLEAGMPKLCCSDRVSTADAPRSFSHTHLQ